MAQNLVVNGREYLPSASIARSFGYTPDYVSRLARESKIVATNVNRKWFVSEESLKEFVRSADVGKETRSDELKKQRKVERLIHEQELKKVSSKENVQSHIALAQSLAVLMCGVFVGLLGWSVTTADMTLAQLTVGVEKAYIQITGAIKPDRNPFITPSDWSGVASVQKSFVQEELLQENSSKEISIEETRSVSEDYKDAEQYEQMHFSDEVHVRFLDDGTGVVRPVFIDDKNGQEYQMLLAPISEGG